MNENQPNLIEALADDFLSRRRAGESPSISEYTSRYPEQAEEIRDFLEALEIVNKFKPIPQESDRISIATSHLETGFPVIDDYRIIREIGRGGMGVVFEAKQISLDRRVALKILPNELIKDRVAINRFLREAKSAAALHHSSIVPVFDVGISDDLYFYTMQFIHGNPLNEVIVEIDNLLKNISNNYQGLTRKRTAAVAKSVFAGKYAESIYPTDHPPLAPRATADQRSFENTNQSTASVRNSGISDGSSSQDSVFLNSPSGSSTNSSGSYSDDSSTIEQLIGPANETIPIRVMGDDTSKITERDLGPFYRGVARIGQQVASALHYAHSKGIIHRDIKPSNLLLDLKGDAWVTDFGLAKIDDGDLTVAGDVVGTLRYMSPERLDEVNDSRCDIYSLGITLYELVACRPAFNSNGKLSMMQQVRTTTPQSLTDFDAKFPTDLQTIIFKSISKEPGQRYQFAGEMADDLTRYIEGRPIRARRVTTVEHIISWARRNPLSSSLLSTVFTLLMVLLIASIISAYQFRQMAITQTRLSEKAKASERVAKNVSEINRRHLYFAEMQIVASSTEQSGGTETARVLLEKWIPKPGEQDLRGWEWYWNYSLVNRENQVFPLGGFPTDLDFDPSGKRVAIVNSNEVDIFDLEQRKFVQTLRGFNGRIKSLRFSNDGRRIAATSVKESRVVVWEVATGKATHSKLFDHFVGIIRWSYDDQYVAFVTNEKQFTGGKRHQLNVWNMVTGEQQQFDGPEMSLFSLDFSPTGHFLVTCNDRDSFDLWDTHSWKIVSNHKLDGIGIRELKWHPSGEQLSVLLNDNKCIFWDKTANEFESFSLGQGRFAGLDLDANEHLLAVCRNDGSIDVWDRRSAQRISKLNGHVSTCNYAVWSPDGQHLISVGADDSMRIWTRQSILAANSVKLPIGPQDSFLSWGNDSKIVVGTDSNSWIIDGQNIDRVDLGKASIGNWSKVCANADGSMIAGVLGGEVVVGPIGKPGQIEYRWRLKDAGVSHLAWSETGNSLMFANHANNGVLNVYSWHPASNAAPQKNEISHGLFRALAWKPDQNQMALAYTSVDVFDSKDGTRVHRFNSGTRSLNFVVWSPDGKRVAVCGNDSTIRIFDGASWKLLAELRGHTHAINSMDWSIDGRQLVSGSADNTARIWNVDFQKATLVFPHSNSVKSVKWDAKTNRLATLTRSGVLSVFDPQIESNLSK